MDSLGEVSLRARMWGFVWEALRAPLSAGQTDGGKNQKEEQVDRCRRVLSGRRPREASLPEKGPRATVFTQESSSWGLGGGMGMDVTAPAWPWSKRGGSWFGCTWEGTPGRAEGVQ